MWIFCCGMRRSGSTLQYQIAAELVEALGVGERLPFTPHDDFPAVRGQHGPSGRPAVFKAHRLTPAMRTALDEDGGVVLTTERDLRDAVVSRARKDGDDPNGPWVERFVRDYLAAFAEVAGHPRALVSPYEGLIGDLPAQVARTAAHAGLTAPMAVLADVAARLSLPAQRDRIRQAAEQGGTTRLGRDEFLPRDLLHLNHITAGGVGAWRGVLTDTTLARIEALAPGFRATRPPTPAPAALAG